MRWRSRASGVQRELATLSEAGLLTVKRQGDQKHYQANADAPVFVELCGLVLKTMPLADRWAVFDNSVAGKAKLIATQHGDNLQIEEPKPWLALQNLLTTC